MNSLLFCIAIIPVIILLTYIYKKDIHKEPKKLLFKNFILGFFITIPVVIVEIILNLCLSIENYKNNYIILFILIFIEIAFIEELGKWFIVKKVGYNNKNFDETYDAIVYSVFVSLGFACLENIIYVAINGVSIAILRALTAVPGHACDAIIMGYFLSKAKEYEIKNDFSNSKKALILSIFIPTITHTIYDYLLTLDTNIPYLNITFIVIWLFSYITFFIISLLLVNNSSKTNKLFSNQTQTCHNFCSNCGSRINDYNYCKSCGKKVR